MSTPLSHELSVSSSYKEYSSDSEMDDIPCWARCFVQNKTVATGLTIPFFLLSYPLVIFYSLLGPLTVKENARFLHAQYSRALRGKLSPRQVLAMFNYICFVVGFLIYWIPQFSGISAISMNKDWNETAETCHKLDMWNVEHFHKDFSACLFGFVNRFLFILVPCSLFLTTIACMWYPFYVPLNHYEFIHIFFHNEEIQKKPDESVARIHYFQLVQLLLLCVWNLTPAMLAIAGGVHSLRSRQPLKFEHIYLIVVAVVYAVNYQFTMVRMIFYQPLFVFITLTRLMTFGKYVEAFSDFEEMIKGQWERF